MPDGAQPLKRGRKYDQVLAGAREVFLTHGFEGAAVDEIARQANVSKATLYSYFPDKYRLFMEVANAECQMQAEAILAETSDDDPLDVVLLEIASRFIDFITSDFGQRIFRICVAESDRFPELGQAFYESGPRLFKGHMTELLRCAQQNGAVQVDDYELASDQFAELCKADLHPRMVFNVSNTFSDAEKRRVAEGAVQTFLARYGKTLRRGGGPEARQPLSKFHNGPN